MKRAALYALVAVIAVVNLGVGGLMAKRFYRCVEAGNTLGVVTEYGPIDGCTRTATFGERVKVFRDGR